MAGTNHWFQERKETDMTRMMATVLMTAVLAAGFLAGCEEGNPKVWMDPAKHEPKASVSMKGKVIAELEKDDYVLQTSAGKVLLDATKRTGKDLQVGKECEVHGTWMKHDKQGRPVVKVKKVEHAG